MNMDAQVHIIFIYYMDMNMNIFMHIHIRPYLNIHIAMSGPAIPLRVTSDISTPKRGGDVVKLFAEKSGSPSSRRSIRKAAAALDKVAMEVILRDREIERLRVQLAQAKPTKRRKIVQDPNERFASLAQILAQANREPQQ